MPAGTLSSSLLNYLVRRQGPEPASPSCPRPLASDLPCQSCPARTRSVYLGCLDDALRQRHASDSLRGAAAGIAVGFSSHGRGLERLYQFKFRQLGVAHRLGRATAQSDASELLRRLGAPRLSRQLQLSHSRLARRYLLELCTRGSGACCAKGTGGSERLGFKITIPAGDDGRGRNLDTDQLSRALARADDAEAAQAPGCSLDSRAVSSGQQDVVHFVGERGQDGAAFASHGTGRAVARMGIARINPGRLNEGQLSRHADDEGPAFSGLAY